MCIGLEQVVRNRDIQRDAHLGMKETSNQGVTHRDLKDLPGMVTLYSVELTGQ